MRNQHSSGNIIHTDMYIFVHSPTPLPLNVYQSQSRVIHNRCSVFQK